MTTPELLLVIVLLVGIIALLLGTYRNSVKPYTRDWLAEELEASMRRRPKPHLM